MKKLPYVFKKNEEWANRITQTNPSFFRRLSTEQKPRYLWIGCSDSRVPANEICGLEPGEMFVHRNIANQVIHTDLNCLSVIQYAVDVLNISDIIVCGHYGCGGVLAAMSSTPIGLIDNWLRHLRDIYRRFNTELDAIEGEDLRANRFCELNVMTQVTNLCHTTIVQEAWGRGKVLNVHGWIFRVKDGLLHDLDLCISSPKQLNEIYRVQPMI